MVSIFFKIIEILDYETKKKSLYLIVLMIFGGFLELAGIGVIIPVFSAIQDIDNVSNPYVLRFFELFGDSSKTSIIIITLGILVFIFLFKNIFLALLIREQMIFVFNTQVNISSLLFRKYLKEEYEMHYLKSRNELFNLVISEVGGFSSILTALLNITTEVISVILIGILLLMIQPIGTIIIILIFALLIFVYQKITKKQIELFAKIRLKTDVIRSQIVKESLEGFKELKISNKEDFFITRYKQRSFISASATARQNTLQQLSRFWTEIIAVFSISALILFLNFQDKTADEIFILVSMYGLAAFRFIPSANRILSGFQTLNYVSPVVDVLRSEIPVNKLTDANAKSDELQIDFKKQIILRNITFYYDIKTPIFSNLDLSINYGESIGIIGPSGIGKSTLISILLGLISPKGGQILIDGELLNKNHLLNYHKLIGYVPQKPIIMNESIISNIAMGIPEIEINSDKIEKVLKLSMLDDFVNNLPHKGSTIVGDNGSFLSGGQCQRIAIARALYNDPKILIFDESTSSLDLKTEQEVLNTISKFKDNKTVIIISHRPQSLSFCDKIFDLQEEIGRTRR